ncbi:hypothetical protein [Ktedonobacter racemifer]|uniref:Uncharacterized protein n=1 Tax=Ktedonobacter racemifer DSM 44963 TaxID=485913 RepID=D6TBB2_KTERA|nr:hypothetical protein [Ktedonobacter racemifer]EFH87896.1 hypothetical protein Krac_9247 [Ktedonobacter racemifer DSM 44963]
MRKNVKVTLRGGRRERVVIVCCGVLVLVGLVLWVLSVEQVLPGFWGLVLPVVFTGLGLLFGLLQWYMQLRHSSRADEEQGERQGGMDLGVDGYKGALLVCATVRQRGVNLLLGRGFRHCSPEVATTIGRQAWEEEELWAGVFPALAPGNYTVTSPGTTERVQVTIYPGQVTRIEWL